MFLVKEPVPDYESYNVSDDSSSFGCLPDEIVLHILRKLIDFKTICLCELVYLRFYRIIQEVDVISFNASYYPADFYNYESFLSASKSLTTFRGLKSLFIELPPSIRVVDDHFLFKWKVNFGQKASSFVFLSPESICDAKGVYLKENVHVEDIESAQEEEDEDMDLSEEKRLMAVDCMVDVFSRRRMLLVYIKRLPLLENATITDSGKRGRIYLSGEKIAELRKWIGSAPETFKDRLNYIDSPHRMSQCYVPLLKLPVSEYVMKGVTLVFVEWNDLFDDGDEDSLISFDWDDVEDREEAAYKEAVMTIFKKYRGGIERVELVAV